LTSSQHSGSRVIQTLSPTGFALSLSSILAVAVLSACDSGGEKIRHLPVLERGKVIGIVSDRDLYKALGPRSRRRGVVPKKGTTALYVAPKKVRHIMRRGVITVGPDAALSEAAWLMAGRKIGALPVVDRSKLVGIVTSTDLLLTFATMARSLDKLMGST